MHAKPNVAVAFASCLVVATGCGETNIQAIRRLQPAFAEYRVDLAAIVSSLPPPGTIHEAQLPTRMDPRPIYFEEKTNEPTATAEVVFVDEVDGRRPDPTLSIRSPIAFCLEWTGPHNPLSPDVWGTRGHLGEECEAALHRPWIVFLRNVEVRLPVIHRMEAFVVHVPSRRLVGAWPVVVLGRFEEADGGRGPRAAWASEEVSSAFHQAAGCELSMGLARLPGAKFVFDGRACEGPFRAIATPASLSRTAVVAEPDGDHGSVPFVPVPRQGERP